MIKSVIQKIIWGFIRLEMSLKGRRIKDTLWRRKLISYPDHTYKTFDPHRVLLTLAHSKNNGAYIVMDKAAGSSIKQTLIAKNTDQSHELIILNEDGWNLTWRMQAMYIYRKTLSLDDVHARAYWTFTFVRNPFTRLTSFFQNKYIYKNGQYRHKGNFFTFPSLGEGPELSFEDAQKKAAQLPRVVKISLPIHKQFRSFGHFARKLALFPDHYCDQHTVPQHIRIDRFKEAGGHIDFIGKFETLKEDFEKVRARLDLDSLRHQNKSTGEHSDWRDYYTPKTAKMIYQRYSKDFERFGYQDEYPKLLDYLAGQRAKKTHDE